MSSNHIEKTPAAPVPFSPLETVENWFEELENRLIGPRTYLSPICPAGSF